MFQMFRVNLEISNLMRYVNMIKIVFLNLVIKYLSIVQIRAEHVKLSWAPPEDDGGTPVLRYLIRLMDLDCAEWITACEVSPQRQWLTLILDIILISSHIYQVNAPTTSTTVRNLKPGHLYRFEVYAINKEGESDPTQSEPVKAEAPYSKMKIMKFPF